MNKYLIKILYLMLLLATGLSHAAMQHMDHGSPAAANPCADPGKPPDIHCGLAPSATFDSDGRMWVVWAYAGHIYLNHSDDEGETFNLPVVINRTPEPISARGENRPKIAIDGAGRIFVSWITPLEKRFTGHVRFSRSLDGGKNFSDPVTVNDNLDITSHRFEALAVNKQGDIYLAWLDKRDLVQAEKEGKEYRGAALYYTWSEDHGATFQANKKVLDFTCECCRVVMDIDTDQLPVIVWRNIYGTNTRDHALVKFVEKGVAGKPVRVSYDEWKIDACPHHGPAISISENGSYHLVWFNNAPERHGLFYANSRDKGQTYSEPLNFGEYEATASHADVLSRGESVYIVWREEDGEKSSINLLKSVNGGRSWDMQWVVAQTEGESDYPFLLAHGNSVRLYWKTQNEGFRLVTVDSMQ